MTGAELLSTLQMVLVFSISGLGAGYVSGFITTPVLSIPAYARTFGYLAGQTQECPVNETTKDDLIKTYYRANMGYAAVLCPLLGLALTQTTAPILYGSITLLGCYLLTVGSVWGGLRRVVDWNNGHYSGKSCLQWSGLAALSILSLSIACFVAIAATSTFVV